MNTRTANSAANRASSPSSLKRWIVPLGAALLLAAPSLYGQVKEAEARVLNMGKLNPFQLDNGCIRTSEGNMMPEGCTFDAERAIGIRGIITDTVRLQYLEMPAGTKSPDHNHPDEEVFYILTGKLKVVGGDSSFTIGPGDIFIVPAYLAHEFEALEDTTFIEVGGPGPLMNMPGLKKVGGAIGINPRNAGADHEH
ncbi:MAG: cupin domain-containing protein [Pseudomonadota bacterium]